MTTFMFLDAAGRRRSPATMPSFHRGRPPRNKGLQYPDDPPTIEEIVAVMRFSGDAPTGLRMRAQSLSCGERGCVSAKCSPWPKATSVVERGSILVRRGEGGKRREVGMDCGRGST
jgi:hypothetical protein